MQRLFMLPKSHKGGRNQQRDQYGRALAQHVLQYYTHTRERTRTHSALGVAARKNIQQ